VLKGRQAIKIDPQIVKINDILREVEIPNLSFKKLNNIEPMGLVIADPPIIA
jgi:hypothetical protein